MTNKRNDTDRMVKLWLSEEDAQSLREAFPRASGASRSIPRDFCSMSIPRSSMKASTFRPCTFF